MTAGTQKQALYRGIAWNYAGSVVVLACQLVYTAATARLISPAGFGAYASAQILFNLAGYLTLTPLANAILRAHEKSRALVGTAVTLAALAGTGAAVLVFICASPWAAAWGVAGAAPVARVAAAACVSLSLSAVAIALLRAKLQFGRAAALEASAQIAGMGCGLILAFKLHSPVALMAGQAIAASILALAAGWFARRSFAVAASLPHARGLLHFAGQVSGQNVVYFAIYSVPAWLVVHAGGAQGLGFYSRASVLFVLPATHLAVGLTKSMYPLYPDARRRGMVSELVENSLATVTALVWPSFAFLAGCAPILVPALLGGRWSPVVSLVPPIAAFVCVNVAFVVIGNPLEALGHLRLSWAIQMCWLILLGTTVVVTYASGMSVESVLWVVLAAQVAVHVLQCFAAARFGYVALSRVARTYLAGALRSACVVLVLVAMAHLSDGRPTGVRLALDGIAALVMGAAMARSFGRGSRRAGKETPAADAVARPEGAAG